MSGMKSLSYDLLGSLYGISLDFVFAAFKWLARCVFSLPTLSCEMAVEQDMGQVTQIVKNVLFNQLTVEDTAGAKTKDVAKADAAPTEDKMDETK